MILTTVTCCCFSDAPTRAAQTLLAGNSRPVNSIPNPFTITRPCSGRGMAEAGQDYRAISSACCAQPLVVVPATLPRASVQPEFRDNAVHICCPILTDLSNKNLTRRVAIKSVSLILARTREQLSRTLDSATCGSAALLAG